MAELPCMALAQRLLDFAQESNARFGDPDAHNPAVVVGPLAVNEAALFQLVEQPGDIWGARHKSAGEIEGVKRLRVFAAQQPQCVVLLRREIIPAEEFVFQNAQAVVGAPEVEEDLLLEGVELGSCSG